MQTPREDEPLRSLDVEIALRLEGFEWVTWRDGLGPDAPADSEGRFLAPPHHRLARMWRPAVADVPRAPQALRYVPKYSSDVSEALRLCERVGLFGEGSAMLSGARTGTWCLSSPRLDSELRDASPARVLCRGCLAWARERFRMRSASPVGDDEPEVPSPT